MIYKASIVFRPPKSLLLFFPILLIDKRKPFVTVLFDLVGLGCFISIVNYTSGGNFL